ncbi:MAG: hypothetical protein ABFS08_12645 [Pseudomonadota bacterium]
MELEELVLKESIVSATGLSADFLQVGIKGDPSLRETAMYRPRYNSVLDEIYPQLEEHLLELLCERSTYRLYIGFSSAEIRTQSVFDPLREETHAAERLLDDDYVARHFPAISYEDKVQGMREMYDYLLTSRLFGNLPEHWKNIFSRRHSDWHPMDKESIAKVLGSLKALRDMPDYYVRNATISMVQGIVRLSFNCDGTQLVNAENYQRFLEENLSE